MRRAAADIVHMMEDCIFAYLGVSEIPKRLFDEEMMTNLTNHQI